MNFKNSDSDATFLSGEMVRGSVTLYNEKPRMIRALILTVEGFAKTDWKEESGSGDDKTSTSYSAREDYISTTSYLVGDGHTERELPAGHHTFDFHFALPSELPSSFNSFYGKIVYQIKIEMDRRLRLSKAFIFPLKVVGQLDLNHVGEELRLPLKAEISKKFFLAGSSPLNICAVIPIRGFCPGQVFSVDVEIVNDSSVAVEQVQLLFYRLILYKTQYISSKSGSELVLEASNDGVAKKSRSKMTFSFEIPPIEATNIHCCRYIHITYEIHIVAKVGGLHRNPILRLPITIGTIPLSKTEKSEK